MTFRNHELQTVVNGRTWYSFTIDYDTPDGSFSFNIHALSWLHAELMLESIKENGRVEGRLIQEGDIG